jgi:transposase
MRSSTGERGGSDEAGPEFQNPVLKRLRISMDGAYFLFCGALQNRKGIDSLAQLCREKLDADPFSGCLFIFRSRSGKSIRILAYDSQGFWLATKRLSKGRFKWWPTGAEPAKTLRAHQAQLLLVAGNPETDAAPVWRSVSS